MYDYQCSVDCSQGSHQGYADRHGKSCHYIHMDNNWKNADVKMRLVSLLCSMKCKGGYSFIYKLMLPKFIEEGLLSEAVEHNYIYTYKTLC